MFILHTVGCHPRINILPPLRGSNGGEYADRGLSPTAVFLPPLRGSICLFLITVGCHPRLCSFHRYAVRYGIIAYRGLSPTAGIQSPLQGFNKVI